MLPAGHRIGPYVVVSPLGSGGMGEVYLADDTRLKRRVALKVLGGAESGPHGSERLLREARAAARLDHVNICTIFDTGEADGQAYIAMQYVEGESLAARIKRKPLDLREALGLAAQAANALAEAHRQGVVHRDVKPENVMVTTSGHAKVLDFGLAQLTGPLADGATTFERLTEAGAVAGTVRYMSPEQVKGESIDERSDVFSLGAVLHQMIGRAHPFGEGSVAEVIAAILTREPPPLADTVPAEVRRIVTKSLEKDRTRRYQTARDLAVDLEQAARALDAPLPVARRKSGVGSIVVAVVLIAIVGLGTWLLLKPPAALPGLSDFTPITDVTDSAIEPALSPDGRMVAFLRGSTSFPMRGQVYVKLLPNGEPKQLTSDNRLKYGLSFAPDGTRVAYTVVGSDGWETWTVPVLGGEASQLLQNAAGLSWLKDGHVLFSEIKGTGLHMGLVTSTETRSSRREIYFPAHERAMAHYSSLSPDGKSVLVVQMSRAGGWESCRVVPFDGSSPGREVGPPGACRGAAWSTDGRWMYLSVDDGAVSHLWRQRFPNGKPEPITSSPATDEQGVAVAPDGRSLVTSVGRRSSVLWSRDEAGERPLTSEGFAWAPKLSRDGSRVFYLVQRGSSPQTRLVMRELATSRTETLFPDIVVDQFDVSPDGRLVVYSTPVASGSEVWFAPVNRSSAPRRVVENADSAFFTDDSTVVFRAIESQANYPDTIRLDGSQRIRIRQRPIVGSAAVSPDGRWVVVHQGASERQDLHAGTESVALSIDGTQVQPVCYGPCRTAWTTTGSHISVMLFQENRALVVPLPKGRMFPETAAGERDVIAAWDRLPGARWLSVGSFSPGASPETYVFTKREELRNLFRIPIR